LEQVRVQGYFRTIKKQVAVACQALVQSLRASLESADD